MLRPIGDPQPYHFIAASSALRFLLSAIQPPFKYIIYQKILTKNTFLSVRIVLL